MAAAASAGSAPTSEEAVLLDLVNAARAAQGVAPLAWDAALAGVARTHAGELASAGVVSHASPRDGAGSAQRIARTGLLARATAENVALDDHVAGAHARLMDSAGHRANILEATLTDVGIGVATDPAGGVIVVEDFARLVHPLADDDACELVRERVAEAAPRASEQSRLGAEAARLAPLMARCDTERFPDALGVRSDVALGWTTPDAGELPELARTVLADCAAYGVAVEFRVTPRHPAGAYFVALLTTN